MKTSRLRFNPFLNRNRAVLTTLATVSLSVSGLQAGQTWDGGGGDNDWGTGNNWNPDGTPATSSTSDLFFDGTTRLTSNNNYTAWDDFRDIWFNAGAGSFTLTGNSIDLFGKIENSSTNLQTVSLANIALNSANNQFNPVNGDLTINSNVINNGNRLNVWGNNGKTLTFGSGSTISGLGGLTINQNSTVVFNSAHTYGNGVTGGDTIINAGALQFAQGGSANNSIIRIGDTITSSPAVTVSITDADGGTTVGSTLVVRSGTTPGTRTISGTNTSGTNTFSGAVALDEAATITSTNSGATLAFTGATFELKQKLLTVGGSGDVTISNTISSTSTNGKISKTGTGKLTLSGPNTFTGGIQLASGSTLNINHATAIGTGTLRSDGATIDNTSGADIVLSNSNAISLQSGNLTFTGTKNLSFGTGVLTMANGGRMVTTTAGILTLGSIAETGGARLLTKAGAGTLAITGSSSWTGGTKLNSGGGTLLIGHVSSLGTGALELNGGTLSASADLSAGVANTITLTNNAGIGGSNKLTLGGSITNSGGSRILTVDNSQATVFSNTNSIYLSEASGTGRTLSIAGSGNVDINGIVANFNGSGTAGGLTYSGSGTLTLGGANTYTGLTTVSSGTMKLGASERINNASGLTVSGTGTFDLGASQDETVGAVIVSATSGGISGTGTSTLTGSSYAISNASGTNVISARLGGSGLVTKTGAGTSTLTGGNTHTGGVTLNGGQLNLNNSAALGASAGTFSFTSGTIDNTSGAAITNSNNNPVNFTSNTNALVFGGSNDLNLGTGAVTGDLGRTITLNGTARTLSMGTWSNTDSPSNDNTLTVDGSGNTLSLGGIALNSTARTLTFAGSGNLKVGAIVDGTGSGLQKVTINTTGTVTFDGANTHTGDTTLTAGTLLVNGSTAGKILVNGGTLGGTGTIGGASSIASGATLSVGSAAGAIGTQTFSAGLDIKEGSIFTWDVTSSSADKVAITGGSLTNTGAGAIFKVVSGTSFTDVFWNANRSWSIFVNGSDVVLGTDLDTIFSTFDPTGGLDASGLVSGQGQFSFSITESTLSWAPVPEPTSALAGLLIGAGLLRRRRTI